jgi:hypothetical protein
MPFPLAMDVPICMRGTHTKCAEEASKILDLLYYILLEQSLIGKNKAKRL